ncbi:MAG TPA: nucleoside triphosphate pyrophosphatase [Steroidobacteraceae bacterium]|nr:nucleoside triphosphate pyrophosphatase [Steroidobacteraceae bacterium]
MSAPTPACEPLLCLASASARRRELLVQIGVAHEVAPAEIDEERMLGESPREYVLRMAREKALSIHARRPERPILAADTAVVLDELVYGKPRDRAHALAMLASLGGRAHQVLTAVALVADGRLTSALSASTVRLRALSEAELAAYWETGEPRDKAGAYAIQGVGAIFVQSLDGSFSGVMGLPLYETAQLLRAAGVPCWLERSVRAATGR